jgi:TonB-linked SusC/RagA family outer membrane protein
MKLTLRSPKIWCLAVCFLLLLGNAYAAKHAGVKGMFNISANKKSLEQAPVKGVVKDETGLPLPGVSVKVKGTSRGTQTGVDGQYTLDAQPGEVLVFSFVGYLTKEITVGTGNTANIVLATDSKNLNEVVVTALGITKSSNSITYDQQTVSGRELQVAKDPSFVNSLTGKVAGLNITTSGSGAGGSTKVVLRGNKSLAGDNSVLYVVDGIPLSSNTTGQPNGPFSYAPDGGDGISNINPDDIESISVLKGASASALYGSQAANGVILITTKKGKAGKTEVSFSSNTTFDSPYSLPKFQSEYGQGDRDTSVAGSTDAWGPRQNGGFYNVKDFFNTGKTLINALSLSTGTEKNQTYVSYSNTHSDGIEPGNTFNRNNFTVRNTSKVGDKITVDASANYISQKTVDRPGSGTYFNPIYGLYTFPRGADFAQYKNYEVFDPVRQINVQNWPDGFQSSAFSDNPYWVQNRDVTTQNLNRLLGTISAKYDFTNWLNFQLRGKIDRTDLNNDQKIYATSISILSGNQGSYNYNQSTTTQVYADALLNANKKAGDFNFSGTLGASLQDNQYNSNGFAGKLSNYDNFFNASNLDKSNTVFTQNTPTRAQTQSVFVSASVGYKNFLNLDVTARNDWSSALAYTNSDAFFYPSVGLNDVISNMVKMPDWITYGKVRVSFSGVGNTINSYYSTPTQYPISNGVPSLNPIKPLITLKPEFTKSEEAGTEWRFFNDHLSFDFTVYKTNTKNQLFTVNTTKASGYSGYYLNAGDIQNKGLEGTLGYNGNIINGLKWNSTVTFSLNRNKIIKLYSYTDDNGQNTTATRFQLPSSFDSYSLEARVGGSFGEIYARDIVKDASGKIVTNPDGTPKLQDTNPLDYTDVGNSNPDFLLGWNNTFKFKSFDLSFLVDGRFGGKVVDMTQSYLDYLGDSQATATARDNGGVLVNGTKISAQAYYQDIGARQGALAQYAYSATNIRLREAALGYTFGFKNKGISNLRIALTARNLFFFYLKAPYDPDTTLSTDNGLQGIDLFGQPSVRSIGFNISAKF